MKWSSFILLAACATAPLCAQTTPPTAAAPPGIVSASRPNLVMKPAIRPPASSIPTAAAGVSTAQRMAALNNKPPLTELPAFTATDRDGKPVTARSLSKSTHWILVYRKQNCLPCDRLMNVLAASESPALKGGQPYVILVAGKTSDAVERVRANYSTLTNATWLADKDNRVFAALKPRGAPMIYAMDGSKIAWSVPGNLGNPARVEKIAANWISTTSTGTTASATTSGSSKSSDTSPPASQ